MVTPTIACDRRAGAEREVVDAAVVIIEVASPSTAAYDLGGKMHAYIRLPTLQTYVVVDPDRHSIRVMTRDVGRWTLQDLEPGERLLLPVVGVALPWADIFDEVDPPGPMFAPADIVAPPPEVLQKRSRTPD
ncbi:MAG: Uma2 family endonuclease [Sphingomonadaceae bacterium]|nr:Uma2 family endonuclease [Sphingomonadaceae bacterium]